MKVILSNSPVSKMTHEQIAQNLNSAREVVSRMLNYFAKRATLVYLEVKFILSINTVYLH